ncbi:protein kinase activating protein dpb11 [Paramarasmius palmivorus]|uniref:Protein kinase activating protein dpb11 n=1 Tax=Paramarasmius palmivorus TaxID=297713 RepID=A0AAW0E8V3_9AGAR
MRRRGNKSTKVPNVKLRPAQPQPSSSKSRTQESDPFDRGGIWAQDSQVKSDDNSVYDSCPRPFTGVVLCATGIMDKPSLFRQAVELGATTCNAFTDRVTHLIAIEHGGAKYMCALERKIPILTPEWVTENYQIWLRGDDVDMVESTKQYRLPIFSDVVLCLSGIPDIERRLKINKRVVANGGTYVKVIERPVRVTHLLCSGDEETDKMHYAEKFNSKGEANIKLVWEEWFWDSLEFGGRFDEDKYQVRRPRPQGRARSNFESPEGTPSTSSLFNISAPVEDQPPPQRGKTKAPSSQDDEEEPALIQRLPATQLQMWASLLKHRGYAMDVEQGRLIRSPTKSQKQHSTQMEEAENELPAGRGSGSFLASAGFRRANSFAPVTSTAKPLRRILSTRKSTQTPEPEDHTRQLVVPVDRSMNVGANAMDIQQDMDTPGAGPSTPNALPQPAAHQNNPQLKPTPPIFHGLRFRLLGEADSNSVQQAVRNFGGSIVQGNFAEDVDFIIARLVSGSPLFRDMTKAASPSYLAKFRTECWLERCIYDEQIRGADEHISFTPVGVKCPIEGADKVHISFSGFDESDKIFMTRLLRTLGFNHLSTFTKRATYLLCPSGEGLKYQKAKEWGIPVINMSWIEEAKSTGTMPIVDHHLLPGQDPSKFKQKSVQSGRRTSAEPRRDVKGKGKATEEDLRMADITNEQSLEFNPVVTSTQRNPPDDRPVPSLSKLSLLSPAGSFGRPHGLLDNPPETPLWEPPPPAEPPLPDPETETIPGQESGATPPQPTQPECDSETEDEDELDTSALPPVDKGKGKAKMPTTTQSETVIRTANPNSGSSLKRPATETDLNLQVVPSSRTPSPMKFPAKKKSNGSLKPKGAGKVPLVRRKSQSASPTKLHRPLEMDGQQAKALQESLTNLLAGGGSLLGKRRSEEGDDNAVVEGSGGRSKRPRATRVQPPPEPVEEQSFSTGDCELGLEFGGQPVEIEQEVREESMRVTYEDPVQRDEKRKLMKLFGSQDSEVEIVSVKPATDARKRTAGRKGTGRNAR